VLSEGVVPFSKQPVFMRLERTFRRLPCGLQKALSMAKRRFPQVFVGFLLFLACF
jgi:hypothetical protein